MPPVIRTRLGLSFAAGAVLLVGCMAAGFVLAGWAIDKAVRTIGQDCLEVA